MRIAIACHPSQGGSGIVATELALGLRGRGHEVHMVSCDRPFRLPADADVVHHPVHVPSYPLFRYPPHDLSLVNRLVEVTRAFDLDLLHAHYAVPHAICAILARHVVRPRPVAVVTTLHGTDITLVGSHPDFHGLCRFSMMQSDGLTAVSSWLADKTVEKFAMERRPDVLHNFVDRDRFHPRGRLPYPRPGEPFEILHVSNFRPVKRTADVVRVFDAMQRRVNARLTLAGEGPDLGTARELCAELDLCDRVTFAGARVDIEELHRRSHLFLLLSDYESFGLSALEAMACGTPPAVSRAGGLPEVVTDGETGLLCPVGDTAATADRALALLSDERRWTAASEAAAAAAARFSREEAAERYESYYASVLERKGGTA